MTQKDVLIELLNAHFGKRAHVMSPINNQFKPLQEELDVINEAQDNADIIIFRDDHGWSSLVIKVRTDGADYLVSPTGTGKCHISCMCIFSPKHLIDEEVEYSQLSNRIEQLLPHHCMPWPG